MYCVGESRITFGFNAPKPKPSVKIIYDCPLCYNSSVKCSKCEIISLKLEIARLRRELSQFYLIDSEKLSVSLQEKQLSCDYLTIRAVIPIKYEYKDALSLSHFVTITFDPARFGMQEFQSERKEYILHKFYILMDKKLINNVYGSFELHKNGIVHAHVIINAQTENIKKINKLLKSYFTDNQHNKIVIQIGPAKYPQAIEYIEKESEDYFLIQHRPSKKFTKLTPKVEETTLPCNGENPLDYGL